MGEEIKTAVLAATTLCVWGYIGAQWLPEKAVTQTKAETSTETHDCLSPQRYGGPLIAVTYERERAKGADGYGAPLHGELFLQGHCYHFTTGGRGRGSIPFGRYQIGAAVSRPYLNPNPKHVAFPLSAAYDALAKDKRDALFIHPGQITKGCIGISPAQWADFEKDMQEARPEAIELVAGGVSNG